MKTTITLTFEQLDSISDALQIMKKTYPVSWGRADQEALEQIKEAWFKAYEPNRKE